MGDRSCQFYKDSVQKSVGHRLNLPAGQVFRAPALLLSKTARLCRLCIRRWLWRIPWIVRLRNYLAIKGMVPLPGHGIHSRNLLPFGKHHLTAEQAGLAFLQVSQETFDLCYPAYLEFDPRIAALRKVICSSGYRKSLASLRGIDTRTTGDEIQV